jgi:hypothetical protein
MGKARVPLAGGTTSMVLERPWCWSQFVNVVYPKIAIFVEMRVFDGDDGVLR